MSVENLNNTFSLSDDNSSLRFKVGEGNIPVVEIKNNQANAVISLQGAHVLSWKPVDNNEVIWLSTDATFAMGKSVRGGIPICWPWFGAHESDSSFPAHGFARTVLWEVIDTKIISADETEITFRLVTNELDEKLQQMWPQSTIAEYKISVGEKLVMELTTLNKSDKTITVGQALHTYFNIDDINNTKVYGLEGKTYLDKTDGFNSKTQDGPITINGEVDRVYLDTKDDITIDDSKRKIMIKKNGSQSTVVWNPWIDVAQKMGDLGEEGYDKMLCVESANAADDTINIKSGESYTLLVSYSIS
jgi:glucose-6-phosphate 1-epimerase